MLPKQNKHDPPANLNENEFITHPTMNSMKYYFQQTTTT